MGEITTCEEVGYAPSCEDARQRGGGGTGGDVWGRGARARAIGLSFIQRETCGNSVGFLPRGVVCEEEER